jgi:hypothetical protein
MIWEPIETRYKKENRMFHTAAFAIAAGVVSVGAATAGGIMSSQAARRAAGAQAKAGKQLQRQTQKATGSYEKRLQKATRQFNQQQNQLRQQIAAIDPNINIKPFDLRTATPEAIEAQQQIDASMLAQLEKVAPGSEQARAMVGDIITQRLGAQPLTRDQIGELQRELAQSGGAGFNIATAGRSAMPGVAQTEQFNFARALGSSMERVVSDTMNFAAKWQTFAGQFLGDPREIMRLAESARVADAGIQEANIMNRFRQAGAIGDINSQMFGAQTGLAQSLYGAQTGQAQLGYQTQQATNEAMLARDMANVSAIQGIGEAGAGALMVGTYINAANQGINLPGMGGQYAGGSNYERIYGRATPAGAARSGFGNFDYGV